MIASPRTSHPRTAHRILSLMLTGCLVLMGLICARTGNAGTNSTFPDSTENRSPVVIDKNTEWNATIYRISGGDCTIEWSARNSEIGVVKHWSACARPLAEQQPLWIQVAAEFFSRDPHAGSLRTLFWGRLEPDNATGPHELSFRMALAAYQSPGWDKNRGRARNGDNNGFVKDLANRAMIYPELKALFTHFHRSVYFSCAEKVLVVRASKLPFYDQLKRHGVKATDKLPFDCMAWFAVSESAESR